MNPTVMGVLSKRMEGGEVVVAETDEERTCFDLMRHVDYVGGHVQGSVTAKKYMRNEIWSMINFMGAPSWFITLSPADSNHPIALYFADHDLVFKPRIRSWSERSSLVARNPVAAARFFNVMVCAFIFHVLGVNADHRGLYGPTSAYYAAVEQQGRLTLHLHTMLWIRGAPSPQTMRERLLADDSEFEKEMIRYLDEMQTGQLLTGSMEAVKERMPIKPQGKNEEADIHHLHKPEDRQSASHAPTEPAEDPTQTMPVPPPAPCTCGVRTCACELKRRTWWKSFRETVDNLILRVQIHKCIRKRAARKADTNSTGKKDPLEGIKGCKGDDNICDARFPREYIEQSFVDRMTGAIHLMKREVMMNSVTPVLTYLTRSNTDTTSLQSGTSMKAIVMYVSDYITKCSLKTYHIMSCIKSVFERSAPSFEGSTDDNKSARKLMVQMVWRREWKSAAHWPPRTYLIFLTIIRATNTSSSGGRVTSIEY